MLEKNISIFIEEQFPSRFRNDGELLVQFIKYYYEWMEEQGNVTDVSRRIQEFNDVDTIPDQFLEFLRNEFLSGIPANLQVDQRLLLKNILGFYKARGTEASYKLLFRILFNTEINIYYPGDDILRASDGKWYVGKRIDVVPVSIGDYSNIAEIEGITSGARARVENIIPVIQNNVTIYYMYLYSIRGTFQKSEPIRLRYGTDVIGTIQSDGLVTEPGTWLNTDGHLSSNKYLQDNFYYQEFSYEVQSSIGLADYRSLAEKLVHPSGTKLFGKVINNIIIDQSFGDIVFTNTSTASNDNEIVINNALLDLSYYNNRSFDQIVDKSIQEFAGAGLISINDGQIQDFNGFSIADFGFVPISLIGQRQLIVGTGTTFTNEVGQPSGPVPGQRTAVLHIMDSDNHFNNDYEVNTTYSNRLLTINTDYPYPEFTLEPYNIIRSVPSESMGYSGSLSVIGSGTITWNNSAQHFEGTGTLFGLELYREDIIEIISTGQRFMAISKIGDTTAIVLTNSTLSLSITNQPYKIYKYVGASDIDDPTVYVTDGGSFVVDGPDYLVYE